MQTNLLSIAQLFEGRLLQVPDYQRGYSWEEPQLQDFVEDLQLLRDGQIHYAGTVVLHRTGAPEQFDDTGGSHVIYDVVDGQQRLTTVVILVSEIRRALRRLDAAASLQDGIRRSFLWIEALRTRARTPKLRLAGDLGDYFDRRILADKPTSGAATMLSQQRLDDARAFLAAFLERNRQSRGADYEAWLVDLYIKVSQRLKTSLHVVDRESDVGIIFEVLNNRGKPLSELEKVKNYLLYVAAKNDDTGDLARRINQVWGRVLRHLMAGELLRSDDEDKLLRTHWLLACDPNERAWSGSRSVKMRYDLRLGTPVDTMYSQVSSYLETLDEVALAFADVENPGRQEAFRGVTESDEDHRTLTLWVERLHRIGIVAPFRPLLAAARRVAPTDAPGHLRLLTACERFSFLVYRIAGYRPNSGRSDLNRLGHQLFQGNVSVTAAAEKVEAFAGAYCTRQHYDRFFKLDPEAPVSFYTWGGIRYLLYEWEYHLAGGRQVMLSWRQLHERQPTTTIEHVLPQTATDPYWLEHFDENARRIYTHDLGNLCLTEDNSSYGNRPFPTKRGEAGAAGRCYSTSNLFSERALARSAHWTPEIVVERRTAMVAWAMERWPWSGGANDAPDKATEEAELADDP